MSVNIIKSVGRDGDNRKVDTRKIQRILNAIYPALLLDEDGNCGPKTIRRIERFQRKYMTKPDGRVDPGGRTLRRLNAAAPEMQKDWSGDSSKWSQKKKMASLDKKFKTKTTHVLDALKLERFQPKIFFAWRSLAEQQRLFASGNSRVRFSFHNAQRENGTPNAYAAEIIDERWGWDPKAEENGFWEALGGVAKSEGLYWGGNWRTFKDSAHIQLYPNTKLTDVKQESGFV